MPYGYGRGFVFRGASPPWPYVGRGRGGLPRCHYLGAAVAPYNAPAYYGAPSAQWPAYSYPDIKPEQELDHLKEESSMIKRQLEEVEARIKELEIKEQKAQ